MANILNFRAIFPRFGSSRKQKHQLLEVETLSFRVLMDCSNQQNLKNLQKVISLSVHKRNILVIIDKTVLLTRNFSKALVILAWFFLLFLLLFLLIVYISINHSIFKFFEVSIFASLLYKYMKIWYLHGQYIINGLVTNEISYKNFDLHHMSKLAADFQKKNKMFIYSLKYPNEESGKILKNEAAEPHLEPGQISMMERFCENTTAKSFIIDV